MPKLTSEKRETYFNNLKITSNEFNIIFNLITIKLDIFSLKLFHNDEVKLD